MSIAITTETQTVPALSAYDRGAGKAGMAYGRVVEVTRNDKTTYLGWFAGWEAVSDGHWITDRVKGRPCVIPLGEDPGEVPHGCLPAQFLVPEGWKVKPTPVRGSTRAELRGGEVEEFMSPRRSRKTIKWRPSKSSPLPRITDKGRVAVGARVTIAGMPGDWLVISLAPAGYVHVQSDTTGKLDTVLKRACVRVGSALDTGLPTDTGSSLW